MFSTKLVSFVALCIFITTARATTTFTTDATLEEAFGDGKFSFDVDENWEICQSRQEKIKLDGTTTDYAEKLNVTLAALSEKGGGSVVLEKGVYPITVPIFLPSRTCIVGEGKGNTTLRVKNHSYPNYPFKGTLISHKQERVTLVGFTLDGNAQNQYDQHKYYTIGCVGIYMERGHYAYLLNVESVNHIRHGFDLHGSDGNQAYHIAMDGCNSADNGEDGVRLDQSHYVGVANMRIARNGRHGVAASTTAERFKIHDVQFVSSGRKFKYGCGIYMDGMYQKEDRVVRDILISSSAFRNASRSGLCMRYVHDVTVFNTSIINLVDDDSTCYYLRNVAGFNVTNSDCQMKSGVSFQAADVKAVRSKDDVKLGNSIGCPMGIAYFDICCPIECESCGKPKCSERGGDKGKNDACCYSVTKESEEYCSVKESAPCVMRNVGTMNETTE